MKRDSRHKWLRMAEYRFWPHQDEYQVVFDGDAPSIDQSSKHLQDESEIYLIVSGEMDVMIKTEKSVWESL
jgi:mannose-6-phosphate isomerase-like protein (cupin superfamily)